LFQPLRRPALRRDAPSTRTTEHDHWFVGSVRPSRGVPPSNIARLRDTVGSLRGADRPFDICVYGPLGAATAFDEPARAHAHTAAVPDWLQVGLVSVPPEVATNWAATPSATPPPFVWFCSVKPLGRRAGPGRAQARMLTARDTTRATVSNEASDWSIMSSFAQGVSGMVSVGLKAVTFVNDTYR
jgi:hypothetical protein